MPFGRSRNAGKPREAVYTVTDLGFVFEGGAIVGHRGYLVVWGWGSSRERVFDSHAEATAFVREQMAAKKASR